MNARIGDTVVFKTRWGWMGAAASARGVRAIVLPKASRRAVEASLQGESRSSPRPAAALREARAQLEGFLAGTRRELDFPVDLSGGTVFQRRVWRAILRIPYGRVRSYKWVAARVGGTQYARAVGLALGANPLPIIVPCHRVVARDSSLGGFTGGLRTKRKLLQLEGTLAMLKS
ncbi:MAG: methylated-DNA--[protein]-cysteine S-methyltransferase [Terriglobales bacterium]